MTNHQPRTGPEPEPATLEDLDRPLPSTPKLPRKKRVATHGLGGVVLEKTELAQQAFEEAMEWQF